MRVQLSEVLPRGASFSISAQLFLIVVFAVLSIAVAYSTPGNPPDEAAYYAGQGGKGTNFSDNLYKFRSGSPGFIPTEGHRAPCLAGEVSLVEGGPCYGPITSGSRNIQYIAVHTTASPGTPDSIWNYWKTQLKWEWPGYHFLIDESGAVFNLHPTTIDSNGVKGQNSWTINISWIGGKYSDNRTDAQKATLRRLVKRLKANFPTAIVRGHRDFPGVTKSCPQFDAIAEYSDIVEEDTAIGAAWAQLPSTVGFITGQPVTSTKPTDGGDTNEGGADSGDNTDTSKDNGVLSSLSGGNPAMLSNILFVVAGICILVLVGVVATRNKGGMNAYGGIPGGYMPMNTQMGMTQMGGMNTQMGGM